MPRAPDSAVPEAPSPAVSPRGPIGVAALALSLAWLAGLSLGAAASLPPLSAALIGGAAALLGLLYRRAPAALLLSACLVAGLAGAWRYQAALPALGQELAPPAGAETRLRGVVVEEPTPRGRWDDLVLRVDEREVGGAWTPADGRILARVDGLHAFRYGDRLELRGRLEVPPTFDGFSYRDHLARQGIHSLLRYPEARLLSRDAGPWPLLLLSRLRSSASGILARAIPDPAGALARGIILGERSGLPADLLEAFARTSTTHILAISGLNIALAVGLLQPIGRLLPGRWTALGLTLLGIAAYSSLVGLQASVVRAALMGGLAAWGRCLGRPGDALTGLGLAAAAMTAVHPGWLWEPGFQLSCCATAGLVILAPALERRLARLPTLLRSSLAMTLAAEAAVLPLLALSFGQVSPAAPLANLLTAPALAPAMLAGFATVGAGAAFEPIAAPAAWLTWLFLTYVVAVVEWAARLPFAALPIGPVSPVAAAAYYAALLLASAADPASPLAGALPTVGRLGAALAGRVRASRLLGILAVGTALVWAGALVGQVRHPLVTFLDVGQGDAILIQTPSGRNVLVDGGPDPAGVADSLGRRLPFWQRQLDLVVLTHPHDDHLVGLLEVLSRYRVARVLDPGLPSDSPAAEGWARALEERGIPRSVARAGQVVDLGDGLRVEVLHPAEPLGAGSVDECNDDSVVLRLVRGDAAILLMGDAGAPAQRAIVDRGGSVGATLLKVPHHGAASALDGGFLAGVAPRVAVISVGQGNRFGHPAPTTLAQLRDVPVYRTDRDGSIEVELAGDGLRVGVQR